jgi:hypothetical protein
MENVKKILCTKRDAAQSAGLSIRTIENLIAQGILSSRKIGRRRMVVIASLMRLAERDVPVITGSGARARHNGEVGR